MIHVTCAIIQQDGKFLVTQRSRHMKLPMKWEFPGGKVESNESEENCLIREIKEELNIDIEIKERLNENIHDYGSFKIKLIPFLATYSSGSILLKEHQAYTFLNPSELLTLDWAEADIPIVLQLLKMKL
ncbi:MAG: (deoxy)nucleoside triphosphate pyrophosphohydrolase [Flavobacteriaceae bacterium]|nr:(deoxy)nucleoside triphosphate pyrophosphohydrolase [Flavobacteriaceae bacterium]